MLRGLIMKSYIWFIALALLTPTTGAWGAIDCNKPEGVLALMMAGAIENGTSHCGNGAGTALSCGALSKLFLVDQGALNNACAQKVHMHLFTAPAANALADLPNRFAQANWTLPVNVKDTPASLTITVGSTDVYSTATTFARGLLTQGDSVFYRWGKEIKRAHAVNPWVFSEVLTFVVPAAPVQVPRHPPGSTSQTCPNLLPALSTPVVATRPIGAVIPTPGGGMSRIADAFCSGLPPSTPAAVNVPNLTWGVSGVNIAAVNQTFDVQLLDATKNQVLDTLTLQNGFPANTPLVQKNNFPGRPTAINVILNPTFQTGAGNQTFVGCFTQPGSTQALDPTVFLIKVDPDNRITECNEDDNDLQF